MRNSPSARRARFWVVAVGTVVAVGVVALWARTEPPPAPGRVAAALSVTSALGGGDVGGFARALAPRDFSFPRDHGPHPGFRTEWWYYTGNLRAAGGRHIGFELTFFRHALAPGTVARASAWGTTQMYLAHFAVTDTEGGRFHAYARSSRAALGLAGAEGQPFRVWLEDWFAQGQGPAGLPMRLFAGEDGTAIDLNLDSSKPVVLQGQRGLSPKGPEPGNASYYYSFTRLTARGTVRLDGLSLPVEGLAWMDREWSTSALGRHLVGWDWFALQLDDGRDLMFFQLRGRDGSIDPRSAGTLVDPRGGALPLTRDDVRVEALATWRSPHSGVTYPARWRLVDASRDLALEVTPRMADQELMVGTRYWEGAVVVQGREGPRTVTGHGYVELVGYGDAREH